MIEISNFIPLGFIPLGMYRSVKRSSTMQKRHPVRDASLTGCAGKNICPFSTERLIPNGTSKTAICFLFSIPYNCAGRIWQYPKRIPQNRNINYQ